MDGEIIHPACFLLPVAAVLRIGGGVMISAPADVALGAQAR